MKILALDPSLTAFGFAANFDPLIDAVAWRSGLRHVGVFRAGTRRGVDRLRWLRAEITHMAARADLVVLEGYAFGARGRAAVSLGELGGIVRVLLADLGVPWVALPPSVVKKLATGKGNASKELVLVEAVKRLGYDGASNDEADALWLLAAAELGLGISMLTLPNVHLAGLDTVEWPAAVVGGEG